MFKHKSTKLVFMTVVLMMVAAIMLAACAGNTFKPVDMPEKGEVKSNGGNAVQYGDWIYYVNGYQSSTSAENTYAQVDARVAAIARIKVADLEKLFAVYDDSKFTTSSARTKEIARLVDENAEIVVPKYYYSGNTTSTQINGIYIFDERLYILTPNDELTAGGNSQANQSVLTSFKLDGSDEQRHYVFTNNAAQIMLNKINDKLIATYIMGAEVGNVDVIAKAKIGEAITDTSSAMLDVSGKAVMYLNKDGSICKLNAGSADEKVLVENKKDDNGHSHITYTLVSANNGYAYYTIANSENSSVDAVHLYYATESVKGETALKATVPSTYYGYKETIVYTSSETVQGTTLYGIYVLDKSDGSSKKIIVNPVQNDNSITFDRIEGDVLYYQSNSVAYYVDLSQDSPKPVAYAYSLASSSGWSVPDVVGDYVITLSSSSVSVVKFRSATNDNSSSVTLTIVAPEKDEDK